MKDYKKKKILILYSKYGDGHLQAARALLGAIQLEQHPLDTTIMDFMECLHPLIYPVSQQVFIRGVKSFPSVYGFLFNKTRTHDSSRILKNFHITSVRPMLKLLNDVQPTVVVSTFPLAAATMSRLKRQGLTDVPTVTVITDYTDHSFWIHSHTDQYIVGSNLVRQALKKHGIPDWKISAIGIPIRPEFCKPYCREELMKKYELKPNLPTLLFSGGGYGLLGKILSDLPTLDELPQRVQIILICGHNEKLKKQLEEKLKDSKHHILVKGYVDYIHELMAVSDLMITKPGGLTTSEAIAMELPMLFYNPIPGQEQDNARFFVQAGVAMEANHFSDLKRKIEKVLDNPELLLDMKEKTKQFHTKRAAFEALEVIKRTSKQNSFRRKK